MPLYRRLPKRGFTCRNTKEIVGINVAALNIFDNDAVVDLQALIESGLVKNPRDGVKILGVGTLEKNLQLKLISSAKQQLRKSRQQAEKLR